MATVAGDIIRIVAGYTYAVGGRPMSNVLHLRDTGPGGIPDPDLLVASGVYLELVFAALKVVQSDDLIFTEYSVQNVTQSIIIGTQPWPTFVMGDVAAGIDASQVVGLLRMPTARSKVQGRVNVVGLPESNILTGIIAPGFLSEILVTGANLLLPFVIGPSDITYVVYNQEFGTFNFPVSAAVGEAVRSLGRRKIPA